MSISKHPAPGLWTVEVGDAEAIFTTEDAKQLAADIFAAVWLDQVDEDLPMGQRMSVTLDAVAEMLGRLDDDEDEDES